MAQTTVIVGGGGIGSAIACFLSAIAGPDDTIIVIERDPTYQYASSSLSAASIRQQFSTPLNIELSRFGWEFMCSCDDGGRPGAAVGLTPRGYLFLGRPDQESSLRDRTHLARSLGVAVQEYDEPGLRSAFPWLETQGLSYGAEGMSGEGSFDGYLLQQLYRSRARDAGVHYLPGTVTGVDSLGDRVVAVLLDNGERVKADRLVNAAGAWSAAVASMVGVALPVRARRRSAFLLSCPTALPRFPILIDASGVYIRPEGPQYVAVVSPSAAIDHDDLPLDADYTLFDDIIWPTLAEHIPAFDALRVERAWAGYYEFNTTDHNGFVGQTGPENFIVATGFSGHGLMHSAGVGRGVAELLTYGRYRTLDLTPLSPRRLDTGALIIEDAVY